MMAADIDRARDALFSVPPDADRETWVKAAMGFHAAGGDFDTFNDWSARADNYDPAAARDTWRSIRPGKGVGAGSLYRIAAEKRFQDCRQCGRTGGLYARGRGAKLRCKRLGPA